jgi:hypothetical protein
VARWSIFREIKDALDQEDIEGLLSSGCPADEYDGEAALIESEIAKITDFGKKPPNAIQCERIVIDAWIEQFGPFKAEDLELRRPAFSAVAQKIATCR